MNILTKASAKIGKRTLVATLGTLVFAGIALAAVPTLLNTDGPTDGLPKSDGLDSGKGAHSHGEQIAGGSSEYPVVTVRQPQSAADYQHTIEASGQVFAAQQADIHPRREGVVQTLYVNLGDTVYKGQPIAVLQPDRNQSELAAELAFRQRQLEIAKQRLTVETDVVTNVAEAAVAAAEKERDAAVARIEADMEAARIRRQQAQKDIENAAYDLLDIGTELLYEHIDAISDLGRDVEHARRHEVYYGNEQVSKAVEGQLLALRSMLIGNTTMPPTTEFITLLNTLSANLRQLPSSASTNGTTFTPADLDHMREKLFEITGDFYEKTKEFANINADLIALEAEINQVLVSSDFSVIESRSAQKGTDLDIQSLEAEVERIRNQIGAARTVYAPFAGEITKRHVNVGDSVNLDRPLFSIVNTGDMFIRFFVTETDLPFIQKGTTVTFAPTSSPSHVHKAIISRISRSIDPETRTILVEADLDPKDRDGHALAQMTVRTFIPTSHDESLLAIPQAALELGSTLSVWLVNSNVEAEPREVEVAYVHKGVAYIQSGLTGDEWIIVKSPVTLTENLEIDTTTE